MFFINCPNYYNITFPLTHLQTPANTRIKVEENFVHVLEVDGSGVPIK